MIYPGKVQAMSYVQHSKAWIVCDAPDCDNEHIEHIALEHGWTKTGTGQHLCPNHTVSHPDIPEHVDYKALAAGEER